MDDPNPLVSRRLGKWDHVENEINQNTRSTPAQRRAALDAVVNRFAQLRAPSGGGDENFSAQTSNPDLYSLGKPK